MNGAEAHAADPRISLRGAYAVWLRNRDVFLRLWRWMLLPNVAEHGMTMVALGFGIGAFVTGLGGAGYAAFIAPGLVCASAMWSAGYECSYGTFYRMEKQRTFDAIVATPVQIDDVVLGEVLYGALRGIVSGTLVTILFGALGLFDSVLVILLPPLAALVGATVGAIAVVAASRAPALDTLAFFLSLFLMPSYWLSGIFYRPDTFGRWGEQVHWLSPLYHAVVVSRQLASGEVRLSLLVHVGVMLAICGIALAFAVRGMRRRLIR